MNYFFRLCLAFFCIYSFTFTVSATRTVGSFGSVSVQVQGTDVECASFTSAISGSNLVITCVPTSGPPPPVGAPTGCIQRMNGGTTNIILPNAGGAITLSVTCVTPLVGLSYNWIRNNVGGASVAASWIDNYGQNTNPITDVVSTYKVTVCNGGSCVTVPTVAMAVTVPHQGSGPWTGVCPGFANTSVLDFDWNNPGRQGPISMGINDILVARFTTGNLDSASNNLPRFSGAEFGSPPSARYAVLSATPCDFANQVWPGAVSAGNSIQVPFAVGAGNNFNYYPKLLKNTTYYFNVKNLNSSQSCANQGICDMFIELSKPSGV